jgi:CobQ-like glutamine amidotransferase family enzyme
MNIYADRGNIMLLQQRCAARGIGFEYVAAEQGDAIDPDAHDLFYIGGGQDKDQRDIADDLLATKREGLAQAVAEDKVVLAVCGGYQLLGSHYELENERVEGLGLVGLRTVREPGERLIGNVMIEFKVADERRILAGFENHGGRTYLDDPTEALGRVLKGFGNNDKDDLEGVHHRNVFGTYLHGPLLPKNAWFADHLTSTALGGVELASLDDKLEDLAHVSAVRAAGG